MRSQPSSPLPTRRRFARLHGLLSDPGRRRRLLLVGTLLALSIVVCLTLLARLYTVMPLDVWFTRELQERQWSAVAQVMYAVSLFGYLPWSVLTVAVGTTLVGWLLDWRAGVYLLLITIGQGLINAGIKGAIGRPRPITTLVEVFVPEHGFSFPSGHVMFYTVFFGLLVVFILIHRPQPRLRALLSAPLITLVVLIGPSRIILGSHWLSDVLAAYLLGIVLLALASEGYLRFLAPRARTAPGP
jgi:membrane-associated phospholipid phosphatase